MGAVVNEAPAEAEQVLTLQGVVGALRRSLRVIIGLGLLGAAAAAGYTLSSPALPEATSLVLLPPSGTNAQGSPIQSPQTDVQIALSPVVLVRAAQNAHLKTTFSVLQTRVSVTAPNSDNILEITAGWETEGSAESLANAVANQFVSYVNSSAANATSARDALVQEATQLNAELADLRREIANAMKALDGEPSGSAVAASYVKLIADLRTERLNAGLELDSVNSQIAFDSIGSSTPATGASVLELATTATRPSVARRIELTAIGLLAGLLIGAVVALIRARLDTRLRTRDDIARAARVPVLGSLATKRIRRDDGWLQLLDDWRPTIAEGARLSQILSRLQAATRNSSLGDGAANGDAPRVNGRHREPPSLVPDDGLCLTAVVLAGDARALAATVALAVYAAVAGLSVNLAVPPTRTTDGLSKAIGRRASGGSSERLRENLLTEHVLSSAADGPGMFGLQLMEVDPEAPDAFGMTSDSGALGSFLVVSAGWATSQEIGDACDIAARQHRHLLGVVVANPEPSDLTAGGPRALNGFSPHEVIPVGSHA